jgi:hypothetical protein
MSDRENVLRQAMALPAEDRAYVLTVLERSLASVTEGLPGEAETATDGVSGDALLAELERRSAAYRAGRTSARSAADLLADLQARQASEKSA